MDSLQFGSEVSEIHEELSRLNLKILSLIESFNAIECHTDMERLNAEIRSRFDAMRKGIATLRDLAKKQESNQSSIMLKTDANSHEDLMTGCLTAFKKANLACISRLNSKGRDALMSKNRNNRSELNSKLKDKEVLVSENSKATEQLRSISRNLAQTVQNSARTMDELVVSSNTLNEANEEFKSMGSSISQSRKLITKYTRRILTDQVLILFAAGFFFAVVFYILRKRVLGPLDPFSLLWASITAFIRTVLNLMIPNEKDEKIDSIINEKHQEL